MRRTLVRAVVRLAARNHLPAQPRYFLPQFRDLLGQLKHGLVLLGGVPLQVRVALLEGGQSVYFIHAGMMRIARG